jgi:drug/metabolite transporter (DMT)-like permease
VLIAVSLGAALSLAFGFVLQQHEAAELPPGRRGPAVLLELARRPIWLAGIGAMVGGQALGAVALGLGSLVVVEPLLAANVLFALPMAALASRRRLGPGDWVGAVMLIGGLVFFLLGQAPASASDGDRISPLTWSLAGGSVMAVVVVLLLLSGGRPLRVRAALLATAAGTVFGTQDFLTQHAVLNLSRGVVALVTSWAPWVVLAVAVTGLTLAQRAFGLADLSASLPAINLAEPVCGICLSVGLLGGTLPHRPLLLASLSGGLALMVAGVVILTRSPLVVDPHGRHRRRLARRREPHARPEKSRAG